MIADERSLARLMILANSGDRAAYATLLVECQRWLRAYFSRRVAPAFLDDLVQDTLMALHQKLATWDRDRPFLPWLAAIARYRWVDQLRRIYRAETVELSDEMVGEDNEPAITAKISLERLMAHLPEAQVRAIEMVKIEGLSVSEAARMTGQSESLIKVNIHRGIKKLAALIEKE